MPTHKLEGQLIDEVEWEIEAVDFLGGSGWQLSTGGKHFGGIFAHIEEAEAAAPGNIDFLVKFWTKLYEERNEPGHIVIDQHSYIIVSDRDKELPAGHGGREFIIKPLRGSGSIVTHNLWAQGRVPDWFSHLMPNTHQFAGKVRISA